MNRLYYYLTKRRDSVEMVERDEMGDKHGARNGRMIKTEGVLLFFVVV